MSLVLLTREATPSGNEGAFWFGGVGSGSTPMMYGSGNGVGDWTATTLGTWMRYGATSRTVSWTATTNGEATFFYVMNLSVPEPSLYRAPTSVLVNVSQAEPTVPVQFSIDGNLVATLDTDTEGNLFAVSLPVADTYTAGTHTVTAAQPGTTVTPASGTFTLALDPVAAPTTPTAPTPPTPSTPGDLGFTRWVLQDPMPGGLGSYELPINPASWVSPLFSRVLTQRHTTAPDGQFHITEGADPVTEWSFSGVSLSQEFHDKLVAFGALNRRFYVIDHWNRAWLTTFTHVDLSPRTRRVVNGVPSDWIHDYTVTAVAYEQTPAVMA